MSSTQSSADVATEAPAAGKVEMKLEVVVVPVSDVDRAKAFYGSLGWREDADFATGELRVVQFTPRARTARSTSARTSQPAYRAHSGTCS